MKNLVISLLSLFLLSFTIGSQVNQHWSETPKIETDYDWSPIRISPMGITIIYTEKYGATKTVKCVGLWEDDKNYLLTFKDSAAIRLEKSNINGIEWNN